jgi:hypothetical protein
MPIQVSRHVDPRQSLHRLLPSRSPRVSMSESEPGSEPKPDRPESEEDTQPMPPLEPGAPVAPSDTGSSNSGAPSAGAPSAEAPGASSAAKPSLFDTGWDSLLGPKSDGPIFAPPANPSRVPAKTSSETSNVSSFLPPTAKPRTSESGAVSGEFGGPKLLASAPEAGEAPATDDSPEQIEQASDEQDDDAEADEEAQRDDDAQPDAQPNAANDKPIVASPKPVPEGSSRNLLLILGVAAAVVIGIVVSNHLSSSEPAGSGSTRPNTPSKEAAKLAKPDPKPQPRPPVVKTHAADPKLAALREKQAREAATGGEQPTGEQVGDGDQDTDTPAPATPKQTITDPRDPSLIPLGTPAENAKAFAKLPVSVSDGPPIGGIGSNGIHIDEIIIGKGRNNSECNNPTRKFSTTDTEFVNVCIRVVHPRERDTLRVIWERDGAVTRRSTVGIPQNLHAYKTRSYLQMRPEYVGSWRVRIVPEGEEDINLAVAKFTIE